MQEQVAGKWLNAWKSGSFLDCHSVRIGMSVFSIVFIFYFTSNKGLQAVTRTPPGSTPLTVASGPAVQGLLVTDPPPWDPCTRQPWRWGERSWFNELTRWIWAELAMRSIEVDGDRNMDKSCGREGRQPSYCKIPVWRNQGFLRWGVNWWFCESCLITLLWYNSMKLS